MDEDRPIAQISSEVSADLEHDKDEGATTLSSQTVRAEVEAISLATTQEPDSEIAVTSMTPQEQATVERTVQVEPLIGNSLPQPVRPPLKARGRSTAQMGGKKSEHKLPVKSLSTTSVPTGSLSAHTGANVVQKAGPGPCGVTLATTLAGNSKAQNTQHATRK
ncbi:unnamed protein product [Somion occarium]|uniref:Uncharacterized protein n=1 Tax=Somion occarium TaxID=3059160 RepID=A0ABP1CXY6_9APHY